MEHERILSVASGMDALAKTLEKVWWALRSKVAEEQGQQQSRVRC